MEQIIETDIVIVGAGPVGLTAAADLDARGIRTVVIEQRAFLEAPNVKCNHVSARTMERFRRLGFAHKIRNAGLPAEYPQDVAFRTTLTGQEITRIPIPARAFRYTSKLGPDTSWATPEPPHRINQKFLEPILMEHVAALPNVTLLNETTYTGFTQDASGVEATITNNDGRQRRTVRGRFLIGADGGRSAVRKQIGAKLSGDAVLSNVQSTCIRARDLYGLMGGEKAWGYYTFNPRRNGHVYAIDGEEVFLVHNYLTQEEAAADSVDRDWAIRTILGVDASFEYETLSKEDWVARRLVADRFRNNNVFIAGDACHLWVPYAGYGMNAGIADVLNLTWVLGAYLGGWADSGILDAYEAERLPITEQVSRFAMSHQRKIAQADIPAEIEEATPQGHKAREDLGAAAYDLNVQQFAAAGLNFGYSYTASPIISYDGEAAPAYSMGEYTPSTVPGCRAPHFWLSDGISLYDELGPYYTLIVLDGEDGAAEFLDAAGGANVPVKVLCVDSKSAAPEYNHRFTLVREDQHVVWRSDEAPANAGNLVELLRGNPSAANAVYSSHAPVAALA
ncbi:FAD-dependent oxidoreductase [Arthrobacter sp. GCM10027362]|uniref:FAD-dependent oxidoreductase n=1 Tax=Arthrobacter sp. GCM10027362 TaxID=3273379 RepID=UPI003626916D